MYHIYAKLHKRGHGCKYRKVLSTREDVYDTMDQIVENIVPYSPETLLGAGEWFEIKSASEQEYAIDLMREDYESVDYDSLAKAEFSAIQYVYFVRGEDLYFQNVGKAKLASKKRIGAFGEKFTYQSDGKEIVINEVPDAIYCKEKDCLYFRKLESITGIFKGIDQLYREATDSETESFLANDFIRLQDGYTAASVKTPNRRRITMAMKTLEGMEEEDRRHICTYIGEYIPELRNEQGVFCVSCENDLKLVLYGIGQRFYTTQIGGEQRIANSVILLNKK